jgi:2-polyprenyl-3-methyl-5-hydroxy-6-metoxy-1,4-benzoquinol methylase
MNNYYNEKANEFIENVHHLDMTFIYEKFEKSLHNNASILDVGSGTGRDSLYFIKKGHKVTSFDASEALVDFSREFLSDVHLATFESFESDEQYDGIWACASLLHVDRLHIHNIITKYKNMLKIEGVFYMSFKSCEYDYIKDGRQFTCFTVKTLEELINKFNDVKILDLFETQDVRSNRSETWVNIIIKKIS